LLYPGSGIAFKVLYQHFSPGVNIIKLILIGGKNPSASRNLYQLSSPGDIVIKPFSLSIMLLQKFRLCVTCIVFRMVLNEAKTIYLYNRQDALFKLSIFCNSKSDEEKCFIKLPTERPWVKME